MWLFIFKTYENLALCFTSKVMRNHACWKNLSLTNPELEAKRDSDLKQRLC